MTAIPSVSSIAAAPVRSGLPAMPVRLGFETLVDNTEGRAKNAGDQPTPNTPQSEIGDDADAGAETDVSGADMTCPPFGLPGIADAKSSLIGLGSQADAGPMEGQYELQDDTCIQVILVDAAGGCAPTNVLPEGSMSAPVAGDQPPQSTKDQRTPDLMMPGDTAAPSYSIAAPFNAARQDRKQHPMDETDATATSAQPPLRATEDRERDGHQQVNASARPSQLHSGVGDTHAKGDRPIPVAIIAPGVVRDEASAGTAGATAPMMPAKRDNSFAFQISVPNHAQAPGLTPPARGDLAGRLGSASVPGGGVAGPALTPSLDIASKGSPHDGVAPVNSAAEITAVPFANPLSQAGTGPTDNSMVGTAIRAGTRGDVHIVTDRSVRDRSWAAEPAETSAQIESFDDKSKHPERNGSRSLGERGADPSTPAAARTDLAHQPQGIDASRSALRAAAPDALHAPRSPHPAAPSVEMRGGAAHATVAPDELGRIDIRVERGEGGLSILMRAERPESADLMRRNADILQRELAENGVGHARLEFSQGNAGQGGHGHSSGGAGAGQAGLMGGGGGAGGSAQRPQGPAAPANPAPDGTLASTDGAVPPRATSERVDLRF